MVGWLLLPHLSVPCTLSSRPPLALPSPGSLTRSLAHSLTRLSPSFICPTRLLSHSLSRVTLTHSHHTHFTLSTRCRRAAPIASHSRRPHFLRAPLSLLSALSLSPPSPSSTSTVQYRYQYRGTCIIIIQNNDQGGVHVPVQYTVDSKCE